MSPSLTPGPSWFLRGSGMSTESSLDLSLGPGGLTSGRVRWKEPV